MNNDNDVSTDSKRLKVNNSRNNKSNDLIKENQQLNYGKLIEENSETIKATPDEYDIFISHASNGSGAYFDEKQFVLTLYEFLNASYPDKVYLDLVKKPKIIYTEVIHAAKLSTFGVFVCSSRYIKICNGEREESYAREFEPISLELNVFHGKERKHGFRMIPVCYGVTQDAFEERGPFPGSVDTIFIEDETSKTHLEKAEYVSLKIIEKIKEAENKRSVNQD